MGETTARVSLGQVPSQGKGKQDQMKVVAFERDQKKSSPKIVLLLLLAVVGLGAFLRMDFVLSVSHKVSHDTVNYDIMVRQLLDKGIYAYKSGESNAQVTPGYPLFMAAVYKAVDYRVHDPYPWIRCIQALLSTAMLVLMYRLGSMLAGRWAGLLAAFLGAVYPAFIWTTGGILTETLAAFLLVLYVYVQLLAYRTQRKLPMLLAGASLGLAVLTRPEFLPLFVLVHLLFLLWSRKWKQTLLQFVICGAGLALVLAPWVVRNAVALHELVVASTQVNPFAAGTYPDKNYEDGLVDRHGKTQMEVAKERLRIGFTEHARTYVKWYTVGKLKYTYGRMFYGSGHTPLYPVMPAAMRYVYHLAIIWAGVLAGAAMVIGRSWRHPAALPALLLAAMSALRLLFVPEYRYNFTAMPFFIVFDSAAAVMAVQALRRRQDNRMNKPHGKGGIDDGKTAGA
ncbi:ArnT family glycosyltransferase [Paenibacillus humicus]|nr:glycosyltransferase family 39 protein [Paenibacillus humicus]